MPIEVEMLRQIPLFARLSAEELTHVAAMTVERHYERGDHILLEGDMGGALHYVCSGLVKVFKDGRHGAGRLTGTAIDTLVRVNVELLILVVIGFTGSGMNAIHRANIDA